MYSQQLDLLTDGDVLARTVYDEHGRPLLRAGVALSARYIDSLNARGIRAVYLRDGLADDVEPATLISEHVRATISNHVASTFAAIEQLGLERGPANDVEAAANQLGEQPLDLGANGGDLVAQLHRDVSLLIAELLESDTVAGLDSLKAHNEYTFQHSVDVAVIGVLLGRRLGVNSEQLHDLALGCLLHDIGKTYIDTAILDKPGPLTVEERAIVQQHPRMGFELCRRMPMASLLPAHVAYQHHERQDGSGYPRGLVGRNSVEIRRRENAVRPGEITLIAEIAAVADVFSAVSSDRPYRDAMAPDVALDELAQLAGHHLNSAVLAALRTIVPRYPIGHWVEVTTGGLKGWRGVVSALVASDLEHPTIRLHLDDRGEAIPSPFEINTTTDAELGLACLPRHMEPASSLRAIHAAETSADDHAASA